MPQQLELDLSEKLDMYLPSQETICEMVHTKDYFGRWAIIARCIKCKAPIGLRRQQDIAHLCAS
jgi:hypothetical protein